METITFSEIEFEKHKFHSYKNPFFFLNDTYVGNIFIFRKISSSEKNYKYFIGYWDKRKIRPFNIIFTKMSAYAKSCDGET